jgi:hypothetical protein
LADDPVVAPIQIFERAGIADPPHGLDGYRFTVGLARDLDEERLVGDALDRLELRQLVGIAERHAPERGLIRGGRRRGVLGDEPSVRAAQEHSRHEPSAPPCPDHSHLPLSRHDDH